MSGPAPKSSFPDMVTKILARQCADSTKILELLEENAMLKIKLEDTTKIIELLEENARLKIELEDQKGANAILTHRLADHDYLEGLQKLAKNVVAPPAIPTAYVKRSLGQEDSQYDDDRPPYKQQRAQGSQKPQGFGGR